MKKNRFLKIIVRKGIFFRGISHTCVEIDSIAVIKEEFTC